ILPMYDLGFTQRGVGKVAPSPQTLSMCHPEFCNRIFCHCDATCLISLRPQFSNLLLTRGRWGPLRGPQRPRATTLFCGCEGVGMRRSAFPRPRSHSVKYRMAMKNVLGGTASL